MKYLKEARAHFKGAPAFSIRDMRIFLAGISPAYLHLLIHNLIAGKEIRRISRGIYTFRDDAQVVGFGFTPFYYGLQEALSLRNLWEQETNPVVITPRKARSGARTFSGGNYLLRRISRKMFFGFEMMKCRDFWIPVSDLEHTLNDYAYFRQPLSKEALGEIKRRMNRKKLNEYLHRCAPSVARRVSDMVRQKQPKSTGK